ncbi:membrane protein insertase YidC [Cytobacillus sp. IB215665]|uniref:membrane protein insertase YidC n=1 Tax=Cytobacillus sp. IB215665 TaxID=3097357 RepID=UPI002A0BC020|nr:membrane protein insertase YidC [Cytobacillus sp. IB215665]MDX8367036.1 membrane protein insertase YidC [Cytobacillus sp. IB215665]
MVRQSVFTILKKKSSLLVIIGLVLLSGCQATAEPIDANTSGWFNHYFVYTFSYLIQYIAALFKDSYGLSIIVITIIIRLILMPMMIKQYRNQLNMKEKMNMIQPQMKELQQKLKDKAKKPDEQRKLQQEMLELYQQHGINPLSIGCLPMIIQFPILIGFYYAIQRTPEIATDSFLWFNLGQPDIIMALIAAFVYLIQYKVSQMGMNSQQQQQFAFIGYVSPILIGLFSLTAPAVLPLYWAVSGVFMIFQTVIANVLFNKRLMPNGNVVE